MAFLAQLTAQTEELVTAVTGRSAEDDDARAFAGLREATLRSLRHHSFGRTNQFEVESQLDGLEERFAVEGRDELGEALRLRRGRLAARHTTKWTPDILDFLLALSDRPVDEAGSLDALNRLCAAHERRDAPAAPALRWEDIAREDGWAEEPPLLQDDGTEEEEDDDDDDEEEDSGPSADTTLSSVDMQDQRTARDLVIDSRSREELAGLLQAVRDSQSWRTAAASCTSGPSGTTTTTTTTTPPVPISELQLLRETLFMLQGLETTLFGSRCEPAEEAFQLSDVSPEASRSLVASVAASGRRLLPLRRRVAAGRRATAVPLLQVFAECIRRRLQAFDGDVAAMQARFVALRQDVAVSVGAAMDALQPSLACLGALAAVVEQLEAERNPHAFRCLELLFDAAAAAQLTATGSSDDRVYACLGDVFFACFQVYLRPIRLWMEDGRLLAGDKVFFVAGAPSPLPPHHLWQRQFRLLRSRSGALHAPRFLQPAAARIFTTGKSIVVLRQLGRYDKCATSATGLSEPPLDFASVCPPGSELAPFAQLFAAAFERWIQSKHHAAAATLQATLFDACGLASSLQALQRVYLTADGAVVDAFASRLFHGLDARSARWHDRHILTEVAREAFGTSGVVDASRLGVVVVDGRSQEDDEEANNPSFARRSLRRGLARVRLTYRLAWPVQIIVPPASIASYQALFTLMLQVRRASSVVSHRRLLADHGDHGDHGDAGLPAGDRALYFSLRARLLWFCHALQSYLTTLVVAAHAAALQADLQRAVDVDAMIDVHARFLRALLDEACLAPKLQPIHDGILDLMDLALRLEDARRASAAREAAQLHETWRLSVLSSPYQTPTRPATAKAVASGLGSVQRQLFVSGRQPARDDGGDGDDDGGDDSDHDNDDSDHDNDDSDDNDDYDYSRPASKDRPASAPQSYGDTLRSMRADFDSLLRFVTSGLRGVARASRNATAAAKWDMLAEMLEAGGVK